MASTTTHENNDATGRETARIENNESKPKESQKIQEKVVTGHEARWEEMFKRLMKFREKNGHCLVPNRYPDDRQLGTWVARQRRQYKSFCSQSDTSTQMTPERASRLQQIGFEWATHDPRAVPWDVRYSELLQFVRKNGHAQVPMRMKNNIGLSNWVSTQRQEYKLLRKGIPSRLSKRRIQLLDDLGFVWEAKRGYPGPVLKVVPTKSLSSANICLKNTKKEVSGVCSHSNKANHKTEQCSMPPSHLGKSFPIPSTFETNNQSFPSITRSMPPQQQGGMNFRSTTMSSSGSFQGTSYRSFQVPMQQNPGMFFSASAYQINPNTNASKKNISNPGTALPMLFQTKRYNNGNTMSRFQNSFSQDIGPTILEECSVEGLSTKSTRR